MGSNDLQSMNIRLLVNKKSGRIIYGEAGKDFVDLILSFLVLPIGSVMKLLSRVEGNRMVGSATNLYESLEKLPPVLMSGDKSELLNPKVVSKYSPSILEIDYGETALEHGDNFYTCENRQSPFLVSFPTHNLSKRAGETCACGNPMNRVLRFRQDASQGITAEKNRKGSAGYVKETVTFIITDDLKSDAEFHHRKHYFAQPSEYQ